mgnify:CR=1 FL=1
MNQRQPTFIHLAADGREIPLPNMGSQHLINCIELIERRAVQGLTTRRGGFGPDNNEPWYDEETIFGQDVLRAMSYQEYANEAISRHLGHHVRYEYDAILQQFVRRQ